MQVPMWSPSQEWERTRQIPIPEEAKMFSGEQRITYHYQSINQLHFCSANILDEARLSGTTSESVIQ